ncbi:hypothetical protein BMW24_003605 [Mycobacterium heckeshornense]|uniref:hypothetical protein n=1 Tax=Mycobacterium heckeshornense TaxID=110505 RepID=UPI0008FD40FE|nr:hypothetical protein [Mycobacterium heckeshornense]PIJ36761.1 hypothetical protein BMW24_003320 [Mycobacterium heckeshornense]PIJ36812.1 hypothetical protein BMW24_003605 [Mycobacterium heckeshornense]
MKVDLTLEADMDTVAEIAYGIAEKLRDSDLRVLHSELVNLCRCYPSKAAQIITALAAWFDPETPVSVLWERVESITRSRVNAVLGAAS